MAAATKIVATVAESRARAHRASNATRKARGSGAAMTKQEPILTKMGGVFTPCHFDLEFEASWDRFHWMALAAVRF